MREHSPGAERLALRLAERVAKHPASMGDIFLLRTAAGEPVEVLVTLPARGEAPPAPGEIKA